MKKDNATTRDWIQLVHSIKVERDRYKEACQLYREASIQSHNGHWDETMQHGAGCPECIRAGELRNRADKLLNHESQKTEEE